jgi:proliferating cell nuclear antigen
MSTSTEPTTPTQKIAPNGKKMDVIFETINVPQIKNLFEALKEIVEDATFEFDSQGLRIFTLDKGHVLAVHVRINGDKLEKYYCKKPIALGVNMKIFYQLIRIIEKDDILTLTHEEDSNRLGIFITNEKRKIKTRYYLNLMDATKEIRKLPDIEYKSVVMIPSDTFHKICRFMSEWSENIEIKCVDSQLTLSCEGDTVDQATTIGQSTDGLVFERNDNPEKIIEGVFSLKYLILFTKCSKLCEVIHVHLQNDLPLTIVYKIGLIGDIKLCLAPNPPSDD